MTSAHAPLLTFEGTLTFGAVASSTTSTTDITVTLPTPNGPVFPKSGILGDGACLILELPNLQAGLTFSNPQAVTATTMKVRFFNPTGGSLTPLGTNAKLIQI